MKIALLNAFPNLSHSAEKEFIRRCVAVFNKLGHAAEEMYTSDQLVAFNPDIVIVTHEFVPKTTSHFTVGLLWSPPDFYRSDPERIRAIRSWDLVMPINEDVRQFALDIHFPLRLSRAVSNTNFFPSSPLTELPFPDPTNLSLAYVGVQWDGSRHRALFETLEGSGEIGLSVYGPPEAWTFLPKAYRGSIPFDGQTVFRKLNKHGVVLAIHKQSHVDADTPSMRVFEACAAKCLIITDPLPSLKRMFGDKLTYIEATSNPSKLKRTVSEIIRTYKTDHQLYRKHISEIDYIFRNSLSLDILLKDLINEVSVVSNNPPHNQSNGPSGPTVSVIIRCGSRPLWFLKRAVASLENQSYKKIGIIFARFGEIDGFSAWLDELLMTGRFYFVQDLMCPGEGIRSTAMWEGMRAAKGEYFGMLDDDDELFPNHYSELVRTLENCPDVALAYSGVIKHEEDGIYLNEHVRFRGDLKEEIKETRQLEFFDDFDLDRILRFDNFIQSNTWLVRRSILDNVILADPRLQVQEDIYFYMMLASRYKFQFTGSVTAVWNWRSLTKGNSMTSVSREEWEKTSERILRRLAQVEVYGGVSGRKVFGKGRFTENRYTIPLW